MPCTLQRGGHCDEVSGARRRRGAHAEQQAARAGDQAKHAGDEPHGCWRREGRLLGAALLNVYLIFYLIPPPLDAPRVPHFQKHRFSGWIVAPNEVNIW
jgi:hypothetical protein